MTPDEIMQLKKSAIIVALIAKTMKDTARKMEMFSIAKTLVKAVHELEEIERKKKMERPTDNAEVNSGDTAEEKTPTLRDMFAMAALQGILTGHLLLPGQPRMATDESLAATSYNIADAMLTERNK